MLVWLGGRSDTRPHPLTSHELRSRASAGFVTGSSLCGADAGSRSPRERTPVWFPQSWRAHLRSEPSPSLSPASCMQRSGCGGTSPALESLTRRRAPASRGTSWKQRIAARPRGTSSAGSPCCDTRWPRPGPRRHRSAAVRGTGALPTRRVRLSVQARGHHRMCVVCSVKRPQPTATIALTSVQTTVPRLLRREAVGISGSSAGFKPGSCSSRRWVRFDGTVGVRRCWWVVVDGGRQWWSPVRRSSRVCRGVCAIADRWRLAPGHST